MSAPEAIVVGAGPAGSAIATLLGRQGRRVLLIDRARFPRDQVCGECLSPGARALLADLGVLAAIEQAGAARYRGLRLVAPDGRVVEAPYPDGAFGLTLSRHALDACLLEQARRTPGVTILEGTSVTGLARDPAGTVCGVTLGAGETLTARIVIGADGRFSKVRRWAFTERPAHAAKRFCFVNTFLDGRTSDDLLECGLIDRGLQYLRVYQGEGRYSVCFVVDEARRRALAPGTPEGFVRLAETLPRLAERLSGARLAGPMKGMSLAPYGSARLVGDGVALIGDAVGFMDPITGEGMYRAFSSAHLAAEAIAHALAAGAGPVPAAALARYPQALSAKFGAVLRFVQAAVTLTTLPPVASNGLVRCLSSSPRLRAATAAVQGAIAPPGILLRPDRWPGAPLAQEELA